MEKFALEEFSPPITLPEKLAAGPLSLKAKAFHLGLVGGFERYAKRVLIHSLYPWAVRWFLIGFLVTLTYSAFFGPNDARLNFATVMSWIVWWPLLAVSYLLLGRVWCAICPMGALSELFHKIGLNRKAPGIFKKRWLVAVLLATAIFYQAWIEEVTRASYSPVFTGLILLSFTAGAVLFGFVFERWTWCRHLCPLGAWSGVFAMNSMVEVRTDTNVCLAKRCKGIYCYFGREDLPGCPFNQVPKIMETNRYCSTCGNCLKACPNDAISIQLRWPGYEFFTQSKKELLENSLISIAAIGVVTFQLFVMTESWAIIYEHASRLPLFSNDALLYGVFILASVGLAIALFIFVSRLYAFLTRQPLRREMSRFGFAFLPLALMGHIGHNLGHFLNGYQLVPGAIAGLVGQTPSISMNASALPNNWSWLALEIILVVIGLGLSIWALRGVCNARRVVCPQQPAAIPYIGLAVLFASIYILLFTLPMVTRV